MTAPAGVLVEGWGWRYAGRRLPAVSGVDLRIEPGERVLLLGASGSGKSTLLTGMAGLLGDSDEGERTGRILVDREPPRWARQHPRRDRAAEVRERLPRGVRRLEPEHRTHP